jgi:ribose transport system ATP-binding protein
MQTLLDISNLSKFVGPTHALNNVDLTLQRREVHTVVGENGAGKSTLIKILAGAYCKDAAQETGKSGRVKIIALDRNETTLGYIVQCFIEASIAQRTYTTAYMGLQLL